MANFSEIKPLFFREIAPSHSGMRFAFLNESDIEILSLDIETKFEEKILIRLEQHLIIDSEKLVPLNVIKDLIVTLPAVRVSYIDQTMMDDIYDQRWDK